MINHDNFKSKIEKTPYKKKIIDRCETCGLVYNGDTKRAAEIILEHKIKCRVTPSGESDAYQCEQCTFKGTSNSDIEEQIGSYHKEISSPESKKSK